MIDVARCDLNIVPTLSAVVRNIQEDQLCRLLGPKGINVSRYPSHEPVLGERLAYWLRTLPAFPARFEARLSVLRSAGLVLSGGHERLVTWREFGDALRAFVEPRLSQPAARSARRGPAEQEQGAERLLAALVKATPAEAYPDCQTVAQRQQFLMQLLRRASVTAATVPKDFDAKVAYYLTTSVWGTPPKSATPAPRPAPSQAQTPPSPSTTTTAVASATTAVLGTSATTPPTAGAAPDSPTTAGSAKSTAAISKRLARRKQLAAASATGSPQQASPPGVPQAWLRRIVGWRSATAGSFGGVAVWLQNPLLLATLFLVVGLTVGVGITMRVMRQPIPVAQNSAQDGKSSDAGARSSEAMKPGSPPSQDTGQPDRKDSEPKPATPPPPKPGDGSKPPAAKDNGQPESKPNAPPVDGSNREPPPTTPPAKEKPEADPANKKGPQETPADKPDEPREITESPKVAAQIIIAKEPIEGFRMTEATVTKGDLCPIDWKKCGFIVHGLDELPRLLASPGATPDKPGKGPKKYGGGSLSGLGPDVARFEILQAEEKGGWLTLRYKSQTLPDSLKPKPPESKNLIRDWPSLIRFFLKDGKASYNAIRHANAELLGAQWALQFCVVQLTQHEAGKTDSIFVALQKPLLLKVRSPRKDGEDPLRVAPKNNAAEPGASSSEAFKLSAGESSQGGEIKADIDYANGADYERWSNQLHLGGGELLGDRTKDNGSGLRFPFGKDAEKHSPTRRWEVPDIVDKLELRRFGVESISLRLADDGKSLHLDVAQKVDKVVVEQDQRLRELKTGLSQFQYAFRQVSSKPEATTKDKDKCWDAFGSLARLVKIEIPIQKVKEAKGRLEKASIELKGVAEAQRGYELAVEEQMKTVIMAASNEINELNAKAKVRLEIERNAKADIQKNKNDLLVALRRVLRVEVSLYRVLKAKVGGEEKEIRVTIVGSELTRPTAEPPLVMRDSSAEKKKPEEKKPSY